MQTSTRILIPAAAMTLGLALAACGQQDDSPGDTGTGTDAGTGTRSSETTDRESPTAEPTTTSAAAGDAAGADVTAAGLAAIATAEADAGGAAFGIDDIDDDGSWEVDVRVDDDAVEVQVSADGTEVVGTEDDDLDDDDRAAIDAATITISEAIEAAVAETGGVLDDAELSDDGPVHYEVTVDTADRDDVDVDVDAASGDVIRVG